MATQYMCVCVRVQLLLQFVVVVRGVVDRLKLQLRSVESNSLTQKESARERLARTDTHTHAHRDTVSTAA